MMRIGGTVKLIRNGPNMTLWPVELRPSQAMRALTNSSAIANFRSVGSSLLDILKRSVCAGEEKLSALSSQNIASASWLLG